MGLLNNLTGTRAAPGHTAVYKWFVKTLQRSQTPTKEIQDGNPGHFMAIESRISMKAERVDDEFSDDRMIQLTALFVSRKRGRNTFEHERLQSSHTGLLQEQLEHDKVHFPFTEMTEKDGTVCTKRELSKITWRMSRAWPWALSCISKGGATIGPSMHTLSFLHAW